MVGHVVPWVSLLFNAFQVWANFISTAGHITLGIPLPCEAAVRVPGATIGLLNVVEFDGH